MTPLLRAGFRLAPAVCAGLGRHPAVDHGHAPADASGPSAALGYQRAKEALTAGNTAGNSVIAVLAAAFPPPARGDRDAAPAGRGAARIAARHHSAATARGCCECRALAADAGGPARALTARPTLARGG